MHKKIIPPEIPWDRVRLVVEGTVYPDDSILSLSELLQKTEEEVKELLLIEQITYWQHKYDEAWLALQKHIDDAQENPVAPEGNQ